MEADNQVSITDLEEAQKVMRLIERLEDLADVQEVYSNADISAELVEQL